MITAGAGTTGTDQAGAGVLDGAAGMAAGAGIVGMVQAGDLAGAGEAGTEVRIMEAGTTGTTTDTTTTMRILMAEEAITLTAASEETTITEEMQLEVAEATALTILLQEELMQIIRLEILQDTTRIRARVTAMQPQEIITRQETAIILQEIAATTITALRQEAITLREAKT